MQLSNLPARILAAFANAGNKRTIPVASQIGVTPGAASYTDGFPPLTFTPLNAGGVPPAGQDFNGILNAITAVQQWQAGGGLFTYDAAWSSANGGYPKGALLLRADGAGYWRSLTDNNTNDPDGVGTGWVSATLSNGFNIVENANGSVNQRGYVSGTATTVAQQVTLDRWKVRTSGQSITFSPLNNGNAMVFPAGGAEQKIFAENIRGGTYCATWTGAGTMTMNGTPVAKGAQFSLPANTDATLVMVGAVAEIQISQGLEAPVYREKSYQQELAACQRTEMVYDTGGVSQFTLAWGFMATSTAGGGFNIYTPVSMRSVPLDITNLGTGTIQINSTTLSPASNPSAIAKAGNIVSFNANSGSANTVGATASYLVPATSKILLRCAQ